MNTKRAVIGAQTNVDLDVGAVHAAGGRVVDAVSGGAHLK